MALEVIDKMVFLALKMTPFLLASYYQRHQIKKLSINHDVLKGIRPPQPQLRSVVSMKLGDYTAYSQSVAWATAAQRVRIQIQKGTWPWVLPRNVSGHCHI